MYPIHSAIICTSKYYLVQLIEQPILRIPNILFVYFFIDFFVKHIFFEARLERVIDGWLLVLLLIKQKNKINKISS